MSQPSERVMTAVKNYLRNYMIWGDLDKYFHRHDVVVSPVKHGGGRGANRPTVRSKST